MVRINPGNPSSDKIDYLFPCFFVMIQDKSVLSHMRCNAVFTLFKKFGSDIYLIDSIFYGFDHLLCRNA